MSETFWNREELHNEVWDQPLKKLGEKYGISDVAMGKICRKLRIPLPGRGYWARKAAGKKVSVRSLPKFTDAAHISMPSRKRIEPKVPQPEPTDAEYLRIKEVEASQPFPEGIEEHPLVAKTRKDLEKGKPDEKGLIHVRSRTALDVSVSPSQLSRSLIVINAVVTGLVKLGYSVRVSEKSESEALIYGQWASFRLREKVKEVDRKTAVEGNWKRSVITYAPSGILEFRVGDRYYSTQSTLRDKKNRPLELETQLLLGLVMRAGRELKLREEHRQAQEVARLARQRELMELREKIDKEEKKLEELMGWVDGYHQARRIRDFVAELKNVWEKSGVDLSPGSDKHTRLGWMLDQADRADPLVQGPPSVLDRKNELTWY